MAKDISVVVWTKDGCSYCNEVKGYLEEQNISYKTVDVTYQDEFRTILDTKYGVRHVPVVEIGSGNTFQAVTEVGLEHLKAALNTVTI